MDEETGPFGRPAGRNAWVLGTPGPGSRLVQEPMKGSTPASKEVTGNELLEDRTQLKGIPLSEGPVVCEACGRECQEGTQVTVIAVRAAEPSMWQTDKTYCSEHTPCVQQHTTQSHRTALVQGRVGRVMDHAFQREWRILLGATLQAVSPQATLEIVDAQDPPLQDLLQPPAVRDPRNWWLAYVGRQ